MTSLDLTGIVTIAGDLEITSAPAFITFSAPNITDIDGTFVLKDLPKFNFFDLPSLTGTGGIDWEMLPELTTSGITLNKKVGKVIISSTPIEGTLTLAIEQADTVKITENSHLDAVALNSLTSVTGSLEIFSNARGTKNMAKVTMPILTTVGSLSVQDVDMLNIEELLEVNDGNLIIANNPIPVLSTPRLALVNGDLRTYNNYKVVGIIMTSLGSVRGGLRVQDNPMLLELNNFPSLSAVSSDISVSGSFSR